MRWLFLVLLLANLCVAIWGWSRDQPINAPSPPVPQAPGQIRLLSEPSVPAGPPALTPPTANGQPAASDTGLAFPQVPGN